MLDPRTKLLLVMSISVVLLTGGYGGVMTIIRSCLAAVPLVLLVVERRYRGGFFYAAAFVLATVLQELVGAHTSGAMQVWGLMLCGFFLRLAPGVAAAYYVLKTTTVNDFVAGLERMHTPQAIVIPLAVMFRFLPTVGEEIEAISRAARMRGIRVSTNGLFASVEYRLVPLMMCSVRIGEELSAAALTRGLGAPVSRTSISCIGFHALDAIVATICVSCIIGYALHVGGIL